MLAGKDIKAKDLLKELRKYRESVKKTGMSIDDLNKYIKDHCNKINFISYENAINNGYFVIVRQNHPKGGGHAMLVIGYEPDGKLITIDPDTGQEKIINKKEIDSHSEPFLPK